MKPEKKWGPHTLIITGNLLSSVFFGGPFSGLAKVLKRSSGGFSFARTRLGKDHPKYFLPAGVFCKRIGVASLNRKKKQADAALAFSQSANEALQEANEKITRLYEKTKELDNLKTQFFGEEGPAGGGGRGKPERCIAILI
ncbi:MAG: hypothetical protein MPW16_14810 [Candidatus Manganitrophus sp.]|nr:MAG: hypothetical protein MPW16_14810 [Candidatus Manganitrophus sp.]